MRENTIRFLTAFFVALIFLAFIFSVLFVQNASRIYLGNNTISLFSVETENANRVEVRFLGKQFGVPQKLVKSTMVFMQEHYTLIPARYRLVLQIQKILAERYAQMATNAQ